MAAILYDLIPLLFPDQYIATWPGPEYARLYFRGLDRIKKYDAFLAISGASREDGIAHLGLDPARVSNIGAGGDLEFFTVDPDPLAPDGLDRLGITSPFVYSMGAMEYRKNVWGLIDGFASLPEPIRAKHQLVLTYSPNPDEADRIRDRARQLGILDRVVLTGRVDDETLRSLYRRCAAFVFPSLYEGFGLPIHEAMLCGTAVIGGNNSSLVEIVGDAGLLADVGNATSLRDELARVLGDPTLADDLRRRAPAQAAGFTWKRTAELGLEALERLAPRKTRQLPRLGKPKPRVAFFSPLPPLLSGISDYSARLVEALKAHYTIEIYHDSGYMPELKMRSLDFACHDHRTFRRNAAILDYHAYVYQMGNSPLHKYMFETLPSYPGLVTLHDYSLAGFRYWDAMVNGRGHESFREELEAFGPGVADRFAPMLDRWSKLPGGVVGACGREGLFLNQRIFEHATGMVFHSPWCVEKTNGLYPDYPGRLTVVPYGATAEPVTPARKAELRDRYGLPQEALIVGNYGLIHSTKMNVESLRAFAPLARRNPTALFILVGPEYDDGASREAVAALGIVDRVRFLGARPAEAFVELVAASDIGLNLRRPPTNGETSSSLLDLLRQGVPALITDVGTFADFPSHALRKLPWVDESDQPLLTRTLLDLAESRQAREDLGAAALKYVRDRHSWARVAELYVEAIEATVARDGDPEIPGVLLDAIKPRIPAPHFRVGVSSGTSEGRGPGRGDAR